ncbi:MAG: hypothetical protein AAFO76_13580 [Cyanobacteria bacterium J06607_15]
MSSNGQDFLEPQDLLEDFIEVKSIKSNHNSLEPKNNSNELKYWQIILYSVVIGTVAEIAWQLLFASKKRKN